MKIKKKMQYSLIFLLLLLLYSCNDKDKVKEITTVSLREEWFPSACYAGDMIALNEYSKKNNIKIIVEPGAEDVDPVKLVISGSNNFGVAGADRILSANNKGADLVVIGVINYKTPTCFLSLKKKNIKTPADFKDAIVGVMTGNNTEYVYQSLLKKSNIDRKSIKEVEAPFDLLTFITGNYDVRPAFVYDEPVSLDIQNIEYNIVKPEDYNVNFIGPVIFSQRNYIENNKEIIQKFINSLCNGWQTAISNPEKAIKYLKEYDKNIDYDRELKSLIKGNEYFQGEDNKPLFLSEPRWNLFVNELLDLNLITNNNINNSFDNSFVINYYKNLN